MFSLCPKHAVPGSYFQKHNKGIYGNIVNMMLKIIEHPIHNTLLMLYKFPTLKFGIIKHINWVDSQQMIITAEYGSHHFTSLVMDKM